MARDAFLKYQTPGACQLEANMAYIYEQHRTVLGACGAAVAYCAWQLGRAHTSAGRVALAAAVSEDVRGGAGGAKGAARSGREAGTQSTAELDREVCSL